jgi:hypothetical protein
LNQKQANQNRKRDRKNNRSQPRRIHLQTFDRAQDGDCRRDGAIAVEESGAHQAEHQDSTAPRSRLRAPRAQEREERQDSPLAPIVSAQDQDGVFERDDEQQCPDDEREHSKHSLRGG